MNLCLIKCQISELKSSALGENIYCTEPTQDLVDSIQTNGVLVPIWVDKNNTIISGHCRVNACKRLGIDHIEAEVREYSDLLVIEANRYREKTWREKLKEAEALERILRPKAKDNQAHGQTAPGKTLCSTLNEPINTKTEVAKAINTSVGTLHKAKVIAQERPELLEAVDSGKRTVNSAYNQVVQGKQKEEQETNKAISLPEGKYRTIVIDPPWPVQKIVRDNRPNQGAFDYPTMTIEEIKAFPLPDLACEDGCHIYLWTTHKFLPAAFEVFNIWGVKYQCLLTWVKNVGMTPFSWMYSTEHVLFGRIGNLELLKKGKRLDFQAKVRGHSRKPDEFYSLVAEASPSPRIDIFSREIRDGFDQYGNEVNIQTRQAA